MQLLSLHRGKSVDNLHYHHQSAMLQTVVWQAYLHSQWLLDSRDRQSKLASGGVSPSAVGTSMMEHEPHGPFLAQEAVFLLQDYLHASMMTMVIMTIIITKIHLVWIWPSLQHCHVQLQFCTGGAPATSSSFGAEQ